MRKVKTGTETALLPAYGRRRILEMAEAYRELAHSYRKTSEKLLYTEEQNEERTSRRDRLYRNEHINHHLLMAENLQDMADSMRLLANENITYHTPSQKKTNLPSV